MSGVDACVDGSVVVRFVACCGTCIQGIGVLESLARADQYISWSDARKMGDVGMNSRYLYIYHRKATSSALSQRKTSDCPVPWQMKSPFP